MDFYELNKVMNDSEYRHSTIEMYNESPNWNRVYSASIDGPPLKPVSISGAEVQIRELAIQIRTTFGLDEKWNDHKQEILDATQLLDKAADQLGKEMDGDKRNDPHKFQAGKD